jgi:hypothetical protein
LEIPQAANYLGKSAETIYLPASLKPKTIRQSVKDRTLNHGTKREQTSKGFIWSAVERFFRSGHSVYFSKLYCTIIKFPSDYGVIAMLAIFIANAQSFIDSG